MRWEAKRSETILEQSFLDQALPIAKENGIRVVFHVFPISPTSLTSSATASEKFAAFLTQLATAYPDVRDFVVGTSPTNPGSSGRSSRPRRGLAAPVYAGLLARSYDALKEVDPAIRVIGLGLSGRGNDLPKARRTPRPRRSASSATSAPRTARAGGRCR